MRAVISSARLLLAGTALMTGVATQAETLQEALDKALSENPALESQRATARARAERPVQARGAFGPTVTASGNYQYNRDRTVSGGARISDEDGFAAGYSLTLEQPLFTSGRLTANLNAAEAIAAIGQENLRSAQQGLIADVVTAYVSVRRDIALYGVAVQIRDLLNEQFNTTSERYRLRDVTATDLNQTDNRRKVAEARVKESLAAVQISAAAYRRLVGQYPSNLEPLPEPPPVPTLDMLYEQAETSSPVLLAARLSEIASKETVASTRAERGPTVSATVGGRRAALNPYRDNIHTNSVFAGVTVSMPIYTGGVLSSQIREAEALNQADKFSVEQTRREVRQNIASNWSQAQSAEQANPIYEDAVLAAERALSGVRRQEQAGSRTSRDVLETTNDLLTSRTNAIRSAADAYIFKINTLRAAGLLDPAQFGVDASAERSRSDAFMAYIAGYPLFPVVNALDSVLHDSSTRQPDIAIENDAAYIAPPPPPSDPIADGDSVAPRR